MIGFFKGTSWCNTGLILWEWHFRLQVWFTLEQLIYLFVSCGLTALGARNLFKKSRLCEGRGYFVQVRLVCQLRAGWALQLADWVEGFFKGVGPWGTLCIGTFIWFSLESCGVVWPNFNACSGQVKFSFSFLYTNVVFRLFLFISLALLFSSLFDPVVLV